MDLEALWLTRLTTRSFDFPRSASLDGTAGMLGTRLGSFEAEVEGAKCSAPGPQELFVGLQRCRF